MPSINDKFTKASAGSRPIPTTLSASRAVGATTITCTELSGWPADGEAVHFIIYTLDVNGKKVNGSQIDCKGLVNGNTITNVQYKAGNDTGNAIGAIVQAAPTAAWADDMAAGLLNEHYPDGSHENITADTVATDGRITAGNGLTVSTGTVVLPPYSIEKEELEKPHRGKLYFGSTVGQVILVGQEAGVNFDTLDAESYGITKSGGRMLIARPGWYNITIQMTQSDGEQTNNFIAWLWVNTGADQAQATRVRVRNYDRSLATGISQVYNHQLWLETGWSVGVDAYSGPVQIRLASPVNSANGYRNFGPYIAVTEIR